MVKDWWETEDLGGKLEKVKVSGGLEGRVKIALDYFDASINHIAAWVVGLRNVQKALLRALCLQDLTDLQNAGDFTSLMVMQEEQKTLPFGEIWKEYCRQCNVPADGPKLYRN